MFTTLIIFQVLTAAGLIAIVLVQRGPGATMGAAFGSGASGTVFGSRGAGNFLTRMTTVLALGFFGISLTLAVLATNFDRSNSDSTLFGTTIEEPAGQQEESGDEPGAALDSAIDDLDEPQAGDEPQADQSGDQSDVQGVGEDAGQAAPEAQPSGDAATGDGATDADDADDDDNLPEPPQGL